MPVTFDTYSPVYRRQVNASKIRTNMIELGYADDPKVADAFQHVADFDNMTTRLREEFATLETALADALVAADEKAITKALDRQRQISALLDAASKPMHAERRIDAESEVVFKIAEGRRSVLEAKFNNAADTFTTTYRDAFGSGPVDLGTVLNGGKAGVWETLTGTARTMTLTAAVLDGLDDFKGGTDDVRARYGRSLASPWGMDTHETAWLNEPAVAPIKVWADIVTQVPRPGKRVTIRYNPETAAVDAAAYAELLETFVNRPDVRRQFTHVSYYAPTWWEERK